MLQIWEQLCPHAERIFLTHTCADTLVHTVTYGVRNTSITRAQHFTSNLIGSLLILITSFPCCLFCLCACGLSCQWVFTTLTDRQTDKYRNIHDARLIFQTTWSLKPKSNHPRLSCQTMIFPSILCEQRLVWNRSDTRSNLLLRPQLESSTCGSVNPRCSPVVYQLLTATPCNKSTIYIQLVTTLDAFHGTVQTFSQNPVK